MKIITESSTTEYRGKYAVTYKDKELDIEEYCEFGENKISYTFHREGRTKLVEQTVGPDENTSQFTASYFEYINKYGTIPTFRVGHEGKHGLAFKMVDENGEDHPVKFEVEIANHKDTYSMMLEDFGVYIFEKDVLEANPYDMEKYILLEIFFNDKKDRLLIIDYDQKEFYGIDCYYNRVLTGKLNKYFDIQSYIQDGERYDFVYDLFGELSYISTFSGDNALYIEKKTGYANMTYKIPYVKTSYGVIITDPENVLYETRYRHTEEDEQEIDTTIRVLTKEESENFMDYIEKI